MSKVVVIEDDVLIAKFYEDKLSAEGHSVAVAIDGESGLALIRDTRPTFVVIDLLLPEMSGIEVIRELRAEKEFANLPIVAFSGADAEMLDEAKKAGLTWTISKNESSLNETMAYLKELIAMSQTRQVNDIDISTAPGVGDEKGIDLVNAHKRVLIVEDDPVIASIVSDIVIHNGFQAVVLDDGEKAHRHLTHDANFAVAILDVELPFIKGTELVKEMRSEKRLMHIPIIVMTVDDSIRVHLDSLEAGAVIFIPKPFERKTFDAMFNMLASQTVAA